MLALLAGSAGFVAIGSWLLNTTDEKWIPMFGIGFFGLCGVVALVSLLPGASRQRSARKVGLALSGVEAALPDTYGHSNAELAALMNQLRAKYGKQSGIR